MAYNTGGVPIENPYCTRHIRVAGPRKIKIEVAPAPVLPSGESFIADNCPLEEDFNPEEIIGCILCPKALIELDDGKERDPMETGPFANKSDLVARKKWLIQAHETLDATKIKKKHRAKAREKMGEEAWQKRKFQRTVARQNIEQFGYLEDAYAIERLALAAIAAEKAAKKAAEAKTATKRAGKAALKAPYLT